MTEKKKQCQILLSLTKEPISNIAITKKKPGSNIAITEKKNSVKYCFH